MKLNIHFGTDGKYYIIRELLENGHKINALSFSFNGRYFSPIDEVVFESRKFKGEYRGEPRFGDITLDRSHELKLSDKTIKVMYNKIIEYDMESSRKYVKQQVNTIHANLSFSQYTDIGKVLFWYYYESGIRVNSDGYNGYPNNGGEHSLFITDTKDNILRLMELIDLNAPERINNKCFTDLVRDMLAEDKKSYNLVKYYNNKEKK